MKKSKKPSKTIGERINGKIPFLMFLCMLVNVGVIYRFESTRKPRVVFSVERVFIPSNPPPSKVVSTSPVNVSSVSTNSVSNSASSVIAPPPVVACRVPYHYFIMGRQICVEMWGRYFSRGSLTSYGVIRRIFPDRILLEDGSYIVNSIYSGGGIAGSYSTNKIMRVSK